MKEPRRARHRRHTRRIIERRRRQFLSEWSEWITGNVLPDWAPPPHVWAKSSLGRCDCRKRHKGAPRRDKGMCDLGARNRIYRWRAQGRVLNNLVVFRGEDPDGDAVARVDTPNVVNDLW